MSTSDDRLENLNRALGAGHPARVVAVLCDICDESETRRIFEQCGSNVGLWDLLKAMDQSGLTLYVKKRDNPD